jgi:hypothetical protein
LTQIRPKQKLLTLIESGKINPGITIEDAVTLRRGTTSRERSPTTPKLKRELIALLDACIVLGGGDCVLAHIRGLKDSNIPTIKDFDVATKWARDKLSQQRRRRAS